MSNFARKCRKHGRTLYMLPEAGPDATPAEELALRLRNDASTAGRCACGAVGKLKAVDGQPGERGSLAILHFEHEYDCPVVSDAVHGSGARG